jgi:hypothetical protein
LKALLVVGRMWAEIPGGVFNTAYEYGAKLLLPMLNNAGGTGKVRAVCALIGRVPAGVTGTCSVRGAHRKAYLARQWFGQVGKSVFGHTQSVPQNPLLG